MPRRLAFGGVWRSSRMCRAAAVAAMGGAMGVVTLASRPSEAAQPDVAPAPAWATETRSPRPYAPSSDPVWRLCPEPDQAVTVVARWVAAGLTSADDVAPMLHVAGDPHVTARTLLLEGSHITRANILERLRTWMSSSGARGSVRCGFASARSQQGWRFAAVALDALVDLDPVPVRVRPGSWIDITAQVLVPASGAKVFLQNPEGDVGGLPTSFFDGQVKARANVDRLGSWVFQVLVEDARGPRPALQATVFAGVEPALPTAAEQTGVPLLPSAQAADPSATMFLWLNDARDRRALAKLRRDPRLDHLAQQHAEAMVEAHLLAHDVGNGPPQQRLRAAGYAARALGENVAHAATPELAHRALWTSPSHRANVLDRSFDVVGVGSVTDADGSLWVVQLFAREP